MYALITYKFHFQFPMRKYFSSIACNLTIASNKQRQEHNDLATIERGKISRELMSAPKALSFVKPRT